MDVTYCKYFCTKDFFSIKISAFYGESVNDSALHNNIAIKINISRIEIHITVNDKFYTAENLRRMGKR